MCGKLMDYWDNQEGFSIYKHLGYGTSHDGEVLELDLCCDCMDEIIDRCQISPVRPVMSGDF